MSKSLIAVAIVAAVAGGAVAGFLQGRSGLAAYMLGLCVGVIGVLALTVLTRLLSSLVSERGAERRGVVLILVAFAIKIPLIVAIAGSIQHFGSGAIGCFSGAVLLVYFVLVVGAVAANADTD